ncbi:hypothetical protein [Chelatococcus reniformis]|uniref:hypothetical protein n=1 Tax=Chelatococcus reniformis TaxID=1494448 RepID=UPI00166CFF29|nr:hypothetical protein [Chelatococcus reniformis]
MKADATPAMAAPPKPSPTKPSPRVFSAGAMPVRISRVTPPIVFWTPCHCVLSSFRPPAPPTFVTP